MQAHITTPTILHFSTGRYLRGGERQIEFLHSGLEAKGIHSILACRKGGELATLALQNSVAIPWLGEWDTIGLARLIALCKQIKPVLIHCHDGHALAHASVAGTTLGIPVVYTRRVIFALRPSPVSRWKYKSCKALIGVSHAVARMCKEAFPEVRVHIVHDGVEWNADSPTQREARKELGIGNDAFVIGAVAHFTKEKCLDLLISLARTLVTPFPNARIVCIGPMPQRPPAFPSNMIVCGFRPNAARFYRAFDAYVSASSHEGLGSALLDAVVRDIPCVAIDAGGTRDLFPEGTALVAPDDKEGLSAAVISLIGTYENAAKVAAVFGTRAREMFSIDTMVSRTIDVYKTVVRL
jgi:glycosyltransferase involved in cell wall biosynthesis